MVLRHLEYKSLKTKVTITRDSDLLGYEAASPLGEWVSTFSKAWPVKKKAPYRTTQLYTPEDLDP